MSSYLNRQQRWQQCVVSSHWRVAWRRKEQEKWIQRQLSSLSQTVESSSACIKDPSENPFRGILIFSIEQSLQLNLQHSLSALKTRRNTTSRSAWTFLSEKRSDSILNIALHIKDRANQISIMFYHKFHLRKKQESYIGIGLAHNCREGSTLEKWKVCLKDERKHGCERGDWAPTSVRLWNASSASDVWRLNFFHLLSLHLCNSSRCEKLYFHNKPTPLLVIWQFPCQPKEFLHHCENHARLPEGRLETQFFYYLLENISVLLTVPTSLYLLGYLEKYKITARRAGLSSVLIMIMMINKWDGWRAPSFLNVTFLPLQLHPNRQLCPCISLRHIVSQAVQSIGFATKHYNVNWSEPRFIFRSCWSILHVHCTLYMYNHVKIKFRIVNWWLMDWPPQDCPSYGPRGQCWG